MEIYPAREEPMEGTDAAWLMAKMSNAHPKIVEKGDLVLEIKAQNPEVLVMMGAGDIGLEIMKVTKELEYAH